MKKHNIPRIWTEQPDDQRGTGRTTKMLEAIKAHNDRPIIVIAGHMKHAEQIKNQLRNDGVDMRGITFVPISDSEKRLLGLPMQTKRFYDHLAIEIWQRKQIENVLRQAERMMKESGQ